MLRFTDPSGSGGSDPLYDFDDINRYQNNIINGEPDFKDPNENELIIGDASEGKAMADVPAALKVPFDILGKNRVVTPDIGAYQHIIFED